MYKHKPGIQMDVKGFNESVNITDKKIKNVNHHCLFFDRDFDNHAEEIYTTPRWPSEPLFYATFPSKTDASIAPKNHETMVLLIPIAPDLEDNRIIRNKYFDLILSRLEKLTKQKIKERKERSVVNKITIHVIL